MSHPPSRHYQIFFALRIFKRMKLVEMEATPTPFSTATTAALYYTSTAHNFLCNASWIPSGFLMAPIFLFFLLRNVSCIFSWIGIFVKKGDDDDDDVHGAQKIKVPIRRFRVISFFLIYFRLISFETAGIFRVVRFFVIRYITQSPLVRNFKRK